MLLIALNYSCTDNFEELNSPKNLVTDATVDVDLIMSRVQTYAFIRDAHGGVNSAGGTYKVGLYSGVLMSESGGAFNVDITTDLWDRTYTNYARNLSSIIRLTKDDPEMVNKYAIARIMKVWAFAKLTDIHGDVPYFESALPLDQVVYKPRYDTQESIYEDFFNELREAAASLDASKESYGANDILYEGDVEKWRKFANSLRLRLALRVRYINNNLAISQMSDLDDADLITTMEDDAYVMSSTDYPENRNIAYKDLQVAGTELYKTLVPKTVLDIFKNNYDPRLKLYCDTAEATFQSFGYRGRPLLGDGPDEQKYPYGLGSTSRKSLHMYAAVWPFPVLTSAEVNYVLAEAALFGLRGSTADAQTYYEAGLESALKWSQMWYETTSSQISELFSLYDPEMDAGEVEAYDDFHAVTADDIGAFLDTATVVTLTGTQEEQLEMIINQKAANFYPVMVYEAYADWRRTGYPRVLVGDDTGDLQGIAPRRLLYPIVEQSLNADNLDEAVQRMGGTENVLSKVWWDSNPADLPYDHPETVEWRETPWVDVQ